MGHQGFREPARDNQLPEQTQRQATKEGIEGKGGCRGTSGENRKRVCCKCNRGECGQKEKRVPEKRSTQREEKTEKKKEGGRGGEVLRKGGRELQRGQPKI